MAPVEIEGILLTSLTRTAAKDDRIGSEPGHLMSWGRGKDPVQLKNSQGFLARYEFLG